MAAFTLIFCYAAIVGLMLFVFYLGAKSAIFGAGYWLIGGRESCGWGSRVAGGLLMAPFLGSVLFWIVGFSTGYVTGTELGRGEKWLWPMVLGGASTALGVAISYIFAEVTYIPYFVFARAEAEKNTEEELSDKEIKRRQKKMEKKRAKAREHEEQMRLARVEEEERLTRRHEEAKAKKAPPPLPVDDDDYERRRRQR